jgi:hypothetical protein
MLLVLANNSLELVELPVSMWTAEDLLAAAAALNYLFNCTRHTENSITKRLQDEDCDAEYNRCGELLCWK